MTERDERWIQEVRSALKSWRQGQSSTAGRCLEAVQTALSKVSSPEIASPMNTAMNAGAAYARALQTGAAQVLCADGQFRPLTPYHAWRLAADPFTATWGIAFYFGCGKVRDLFCGHIALITPEGKLCDNSGEKTETEWWKSRRWLVLQPRWG